MRAKGRSPVSQYGRLPRAPRTGSCEILARTLTLLLPWSRNKLSEDGQVADQVSQEVVAEGDIALIRLSVLKMKPRDQRREDEQHQKPQSKRWGSAQSR